MLPSPRGQSSALLRVALLAGLDRRRLPSVDLGEQLPEVVDDGSGLPPHRGLPDRDHAWGTKAACRPTWAPWMSSNSRLPRRPRRRMDPPTAARSARKAPACALVHSTRSVDRAVDARRTPSRRRSLVRARARSCWTDADLKPRSARLRTAARQRVGDGGFLPTSEVRRPTGARRGDHAIPSPRPGSRCGAVAAADPDRLLGKKADRGLARPTAATRLRRLDRGARGSGCRPNRRHRLDRS